jgi:hypothetical protein
MAVTLNRVNSAPIMNNDFPYEFNQWVFNTIDTLNDDFDAIDNVLVSQTLVPSSTTSIDAETNSLYIPSSGSLTLFQLPEVTAEDIGSIVEIAGAGAGGWRLLTDSGVSTIKIASTGSSAATSISSSSQYDCIKIMLVNATTWNTLSSETTGFVIV